MLVRGVPSMHQISKKYGITVQSLARHLNNHISKKTARALVYRDIIEPEDRELIVVRTGEELLGGLDDLLTKAMKLYRGAVAEMDEPAVEPDEEGNYSLKDLRAMARTIASSRKDALKSIEVMSNLYGRYGDFIKLSHELRPLEELVEDILPASVQELLTDLEDGGV